MNDIRYHVRRTIILPNGWCSMPPEPVPADPGWDEDLAWLDRDPERESWLDRAREHDEPPLEEEYEDHVPLTAHELAEIEDAAGDELLAVAAAASGRRGPGQPGSARVFPGASSSPAAGFGPGMIFDVLPGCAQLAVAADAAVGDDDRFDGVPEGELVGVLCAWDRVEAHAARCDFEHNTPYEAGGRTCLCNGGPKCRYDHRLKQPGWKVEQLPDGTFRWTT